MQAKQNHVTIRKKKNISARSQIHTHTKIETEKLNMKTKRCKNNTSGEITLFEYL